MNLQQSKELFSLYAKDKAKTHIDYKYIVDLADKYKKIITGKKIESLLAQFVQREDASMFAQRVRLTKGVTQAVASMVKKPFYKVSRNKKVKKEIDVSDKNKKAFIEEMQMSFIGTGGSKSLTGLDAFLETTFINRIFTDPNSWVVIEWTAKNKTELPKPWPYVASAAEAIDFKIENEVTKWLLLRTSIKYEEKDGRYTATEGKTLRDGFKYTLYDSENTFVFEQVGKFYEANSAIGDIEIFEVKDGEKYAVRAFNHKIGFVPAFRVGYDKDLYTEERTFVNPIEPAMPYFEKLIERNSELDLTNKLHVFPQKMQYVEKCEGKPNEPSMKCFGGKLATGIRCPECKGSGFKVHTTAQDALLFKMPEDKDQLFDLDKLMVYKAPPVEIVNLIREQVRETAHNVLQTVFPPSNILQVYSNGQTDAAGNIGKTATEVNDNIDSKNDALSPFARAYSAMWVSITSVFARIVDLDLSKVTLLHSFPNDLKLKTVTMLINDLKTINDAEAPEFLRDAVTNDIADLTFADEPEELERYYVKRSFNPFAGKSEVQIGIALTSQYVREFDKILYLNFQQIFAEIERDYSDGVKDFWKMKFNDQWKIVGEKVNSIISDIQKGSADRFTISDLGGVNETHVSNQNASTQTGDNSTGNNTGSSNQKSNVEDQSNI